MTAVPYIPPYEMHETGIEFGEQTYPWMQYYGQVPLRYLTSLLSPHGLLGRRQGREAMTGEMTMLGVMFFSSV